METNKIEETHSEETGSVHKDEARKPLAAVHFNGIAYSVYEYRLRSESEESFEKRKEVLGKIQDAIQNRFPRTFDIGNVIRWGEFVERMEAACEEKEEFEKVCEYVSIREEAERQHEKRWPDKSGLPFAERPFNKVCSGYFHHKDDRGKELQTVASFLKGGTLNVEAPVADIETQLKGKRILVLGDDTGSFSEVLNSFGAQAVGIEYDEVKVIVAHTGIFAESGRPQKQVTLGDIADILDPTSKLYQSLHGQEPFDVVYSYAMFNAGSGIEKAVKKVAKVSRIGEEAEKKFGEKLTGALMSLLKDDGFCLHTEVDMHSMFGSIYYTEYAEGAYVGHSMVYIPKS